MRREILAVIPARGGSKGVPQKNIRPLAGKPLIYYAIEAARRARRVTRTIVSTDSPEIARIAERLGAEVPFLRPPELAVDDVQDLPVFDHALRWLEENEAFRPTAVVHIRPTAPLRTARHIDAAIKVLLAHPEWDSVRSICPAPKHPFKMWRLDRGMLKPFVPERLSGIREAYNYPRQKLPSAYVQNGSVDVIWTKTIVRGRSMSGRVIGAYLMAETESVNIDTEIDFIVSEALMCSRAVRKARAR